MGKERTGLWLKKELYLKSFLEEERLSNLGPLRSEWGDTELAFVANVHWKIFDMHATKEFHMYNFWALRSAGSGFWILGGVVWWGIGVCGRCENRSMTDKGAGALRV